MYDGDWSRSLDEQLLWIKSNVFYYFMTVTFYLSQFPNTIQAVIKEQKLYFSVIFTRSCDQNPVQSS